MRLNMAMIPAGGGGAGDGGAPAESHVADAVVAGAGCGGRHCRIAACAWAFALASSAGGAAPLVVFAAGLGGVALLPADQGSFCTNGSSQAAAPPVIGCCGGGAFAGLLAWPLALQGRRSQTDANEHKN